MRVRALATSLPKDGPPTLMFTALMVEPLAVRLANSPSPSCMSPTRRPGSRHWNRIIAVAHSSGELAGGTEASAIFYGQFAKFSKAHDGIARGIDERARVGDAEPPRGNAPDEQPATVHAALREDVEESIAAEADGKLAGDVQFAADLDDEFGFCVCGKTDACFRTIDDAPFGNIEAGDAFDAHAKALAGDDRVGASGTADVRGAPRYRQALLPNRDHRARC